MDLSGNIYIAEDRLGDIRKLNCGGEITPASEFEITGVGGLNFGVIDNLLFANDPAVTGVVEVFDICSGAAPFGTICFENMSAAAWGMYIDPNDQTIYASSNFSNRAVYKATVADINSGACVPVLIPQGTSASIAIGDNFIPLGQPQANGITTDDVGNIYIVFSRPFPSSGTPTIIRKYSPAGILLAESILDNDPGDGTVGQFSDAVGIVYSSTSGLLYTSNNILSPDEDCISIFDTDPDGNGTLEYIGTGFPNPPVGDVNFENQLAKGIGKTVECCANPAVQEIDVTECVPPGGDSSFRLSDIFGCEGVFCEGNDWLENSADANVTYDPCTQGVVISGAGGCGSYSKVSDGSNAPNCGAFNITINICVYIEPSSPAISIFDNVCEPATAGSISVDTPCTAGNTIEFSTNGGASWSATPPAYDTANSVTVRARCVNDGNNTCLSAETADVATAPEECCPPENCINQFGEFTIIKNTP